MFFLSKTLERAWDTTLFPSPIGAVFTVFLTLFEITLSRRRRWQLFLQPHFIVCHKEEENICSNSDEYDLHLYGFIPVMGFLKQWMALVCTCIHTVWNSNLQTPQFDQRGSYTSAGGKNFTNYVFCHP